MSKFLTTLYFFLALAIFTNFAQAEQKIADTASQYATQTGPWSFDYLPLRDALHQKIVNTRMQAGSSDAKPRLIFTAGPAGAGKSFVTSALEKLNLLDVSEFILIDPDSIKDDIPEYEGLKKSNSEQAAQLVHRESGHIQEKLFESALKAKKNIIVDGTLLGKDWWVTEFRRIRQTHPEFAISIISVSAPKQILLDRVEARGKVTGRFVPKELVIQMSDGVRDSVEYLSPYADLTLEIENGISPTIKSVQVRGKKVSTHLDLSGQLGPAVQKNREFELTSTTDLVNLAQNRKVVVLAGHGPLGYEDFSLLKSYVDQIISKYGANTLFVLSHENGIGRAHDWITTSLNKKPASGSMVVISDNPAIESIFSSELKLKTEVIALRGETSDVFIIQKALAQQIPVTLIRDSSLDPQTESVALQLTKDAHFDADPTKKFENVGYRKSSLSLLKAMDLSFGQRRSAERTRNLRDLYRRIEEVSDQELIRTVLAAYPELILLTEGVVMTPEAQSMSVGQTQKSLHSKELNWLILKDDLAYPTVNESVSITLDQSISNLLFNKQYPEFDRTVSALLLFKRFLSGDYENFVKGQPENNKLSKESFLEMSSLLRRVAFNPSTRDALFSFLTINNLGKSEAAINYLKKSSGLKATNHQIVMSELLALYPFISPSFQRLDEYQRELVLNSFEKEFNLGQFAQGEAPAGFLKEHALRTQDQKDFYLATSILKIAAARGQDSLQGSLVMTQSTYSSIKLAIDSLKKLENSENSIKEVYGDFLHKKGSKLIPEDHNELWLTRVCLMFRCQTAADGEALLHAFQRLPIEKQNILRREFSATGFKNDPALLLYYGPAMLDALRKVPDQADFLNQGLEILTQIFSASRQEIQKHGSEGIIQIRMDAIIKQLREAASPIDSQSTEIYSDVNYGLSARLHLNQNKGLEKESFIKLLKKPPTNICKEIFAP